MEHIKFVVKLYRNQVREGRIFLHEHPANAKSWMLKEIRQVMKMEGVEVVEADQCRFGLKTRATVTKLMPAKKPTKFMTNSRAIGAELSRMCDGSHKHQQLLDGRAEGAARYPEDLCKAICRGIAKETKREPCISGPLCKCQMDISADAETWRSSVKRNKS